MRKSVAALICLGVIGATAGCGSADTNTASSGQPLRVAYASALDPNDIADQMGLQKASASVRTLTDDSAVVAGLLDDSIDVGNVYFDAAIKAVSQGVPLKIIYISQTHPEYVLVSRPEFPSISDLAGKRVAYHTKGSQTDIFVNALIRQKAPEIYDSVRFLGLEESSRRAKALASNRLDATALEAINLAELKKQGDYHQLGTWADLRGQADAVLGTAWITTEEKYTNDKGRLRNLVRDLQAGYDRFYTDKEGWLSLAKSKLPDVDQSLLPDVYEIYKAQDMYPRSGTPAVTPKIFATNDRFFRKLGEWEDKQSDDIVAYDLIKAGGQSG